LWIAARIAQLRFRSDRSLITECLRKAPTSKGRLARSNSSSKWGMTTTVGGARVNLQLQTHVSAGENHAQGSSCCGCLDSGGMELPCGLRGPAKNWWICVKWRCRRGTRAPFAPCAPQIESRRICEKRSSALAPARQRQGNRTRPLTAVTLAPAISLLSFRPWIASRDVVYES